MMPPAVLLCIAVTVLFAAAAPALGRKLPPAMATRLLVPASLAVATSGVFVLAVVAFTWIGQFPPIAQYGSWSPTALRAMSPIPAWPAAACGLLAGLATGWAALIAYRRARAVLHVHRACRRITAAGRLIVLHDQRPDAFTTPHPAARIIITTGLLHALTTEQQRALLAHESSHLTHRHAWWNLTAELAAAINPMLRPTTATIAHAVERWADEDAARAVGDRRLLARTLARAALLQNHPSQTAQSAAVAATGGNVVNRVHALLAPTQTRRTSALAILLALLLTTALAAAAVQHTGESLFEHAARHPHPAGHA
jgi:Zn-dependent protease with chaperone function